jgi:methionyl-tRNA synthetase
VPEGEPTEETDYLFLQRIRELIDQAAENYETFHLRAASQTVMELAQAGNVYFDRKSPWKDVKHQETRKRMETTIACCLSCLKALALISSPIIPQTAQKLWQFLGYTTKLSEQSWNTVVGVSVTGGEVLPQPEILFQKIEEDQIKKEIAQLHAQIENKEKEAVVPVTTPVAPLKAMIQYADIEKLDLRVGVILEAQPVPKSKKLLQLKVDIGVETRTIVSGISQYCTPESLIGKRVIVVANLAPATLMGVESKGMILAGSTETSLEVPSFSHLPPGSKVT